eukprot:TRINITY_DN24851_c0_g1_i1.p1 TRINITY_DN24851_c0_g1~~TRINITY_DN24851_c0_g1_i1.p1  ORF type:complete len:521 (-),score=83.98 TRINITY_DN24851_c0_g1_i1:313-1875(-)
MRQQLGNAAVVAADDRTDIDLAMPLTSMTAMLREGKVSSEQVVRAALERARAKPASFVRLFESSTVVEARAADIRRSTCDVRGILAGVPLAVKDCLDVAFQPTAAGSPKFLGARMAEEDCVAVERLKAAGAIVMGKTHQTELGIDGIGYNLHYETPLCAFGYNRGGCAPGGSSSGSAVAVAEGLVPAAIGTDSGGSIRIPAAWSGITGFQPTARRVPLPGTQALAESLDTIGPMANCVEDCAMLHKIMEGQADPGAPLEIPAATSLRFLVPVSGWAPWPGLKTMDTAVRVAFEGALDALKAEGMTIERSVALPLDDLSEPFKVVLRAEASATFKELISDEARRQELDPIVRRWLDRGAETSAAEYLRALSALRKARALCDQATKGYSAILMPTVAMRPPKVADMLKSEEAMIEATNKARLCASVSNALERCAVTIPCHAPPLHKMAEPVPCGLMVVGETGGDWECLKVAAAVEKALRRCHLGTWHPTRDSSRRLPERIVNRDLAKAQDFKRIKLTPVQAY